jgi:hypothetical protein
VPADNTATLKIWDFGGQDIYHGTRALFLKTCTVFLLVWEPGSENTREHHYGCFTFRKNHRKMDITRRFSLGCGIAMEQSKLYPGLLKVVAFKVDSGAYTNWA